MEWGRGMEIQGQFPENLMFPKNMGFDNTKNPGIRVHKMSDGWKGIAEPQKIGRQLLKYK